MQESVPTQDFPDFFHGLFDLLSLQKSISAARKDTQCPVQSALLRAFDDNISRMLFLFRPAMYLVERGDFEHAWVAADAALVAGIPLLFEFEELGGWLFPEKPKTLQEVNAMAELLSQRGFSHTEVRDAVKDMERRPPRRPRDLKKRAAHIAGFELMLSGKSYGEAKRRLCTQGFTATSEETLRQGIRQLKNLLRRYAPDLVAQFENLHPDRAKKVNP